MDRRMAAGLDAYITGGEDQFVDDEEAEPMIVVTLDATVGIYGHDGAGRPWTTFTMLNFGSGEGCVVSPAFCDICHAPITRGWVSGVYHGEARRHVCGYHVLTVGRNTEASEGVGRTMT